MADHTFLPPGGTGAADILSASAIIATLVGWLPPIAAVLGIIWYCILIYEYIRKKRKK